MGWFERQRHKEEADKEADLHLPESPPRRAEGETGDFEQGESKFRFLFDNMRSGVAIYQVFNDGADFVIIDFNWAAEKLENVRREDIIGKNVVEVFPGIKEMGLLEVLRRVWKTGEAEFSQATLYRDPTRTGWRENYIYKLPSGEIVAICDDVTERKRAELALRMGEQRFRAIADYTYHWESWVGPTGTLFWVNPAVERITGYTVEECLKMADYPMPLIHEADRETMTDILRESRKGGVGKDIEFRIRRKDGRIIWGEIAWQGIYDNKGVYQGYRASIDDITERALAQEALKASEERYRALVENVELGIMMVDVDHTVIMANSGIGKLFGRSVSEVVGKKCNELWSEKCEGASCRCPGDIALETCGRVVVEREGIRAGGSRFPARVQAFPVYLTGELSAYFIEVVEDITEDKLAQEKVRESERRYSSFVQNFNGIAFRTKPDFTPIFIHGMVQDITGYTDEEFTSGKVRWEQIIHPDDMRLAYDSETEKLQTVPGFSSDKEYRIIRKDGEVRWVHHRAQNQAGEDGKVAYVQGTIYDITDRKLAETSLVNLASLLSSTIESTFNGILVVDRKGRIIRFNQKFVEMWRIPDSVLATHDDKQALDFVVSQLSDPEGFLRKVQELYNNPERESFDTINFKDGRVFERYSRPQKIDDETIGRVWTFHDITERKQAEEKLRSEEQKYHEIIDSLAEGIGISGENYIWTYVNKRFADMLRYGQDEMIGRKVTDFMDEQNRQMMAEQISQRKRGVSEPYDVGWVTKDGHKVYTIVSPKGIYDEQGRFLGSFGVLVDITERKKAEDERESLLKALEQKNKELESILYVASHDLKSALLSIESLSSDLKDSCGLVKLVLEEKFEQLDEKSRSVFDRDIPETVKSILSSAGRMDALLSGLLRLSHAGSVALNLERLDMNKILAEIIGNMKQQIAEKKVSVEIEKLPICFGDASQIKEVFSNLLDNALKYLDDSRRGMVRVWGRIEDGQSIYCVEDNGIGIGREHYEKIFDMFYQLEHGKKRGEGLGLTIVRRILERNNGKAWVASEGGKGSRFYVSLPQK